MAVEAIQKNNYNNSNRMSVAGSATFGALAGYSLKWALPITPQEKDEKYSLELNRINKESRQARNAEKELIASSKLDGADKFVKMNKEGKLTLSEIEKLPDPDNAQVRKLFVRINNAALKSKTEGQKALVNLTKGIRPTSTFVLLGLTIATGIALVHNLVQRVNEVNAREYNS